MLSCYIQFKARRGCLLNTQAHLLLAAALLCRSASLCNPSTLRRSPTDESNETIINSPVLWRTVPALSGGTDQRVWPANAAVLVGALMPDISLFLMFAQAKARGIDDHVIWGELYYSAFWQNIGAMTNSVPVYLALTVLGWCLLARMRSQAIVILGFGLAALLHCLTDLPLHVDDGHAHFWPFSAWIFESPVSYWDSDHYGNYWLPIEFLIASLSTLTIWRAFQSRWVRVAVVFGLLFYPMMLVFWLYLMR